MDAKKKLFISLLIFLSINCFSQSKTKENNHLKFNNRNENISILIKSGNNFLELNKNEELTIKLDNIDPKTVSLSGKGIKYLHNKIKLEDQIKLMVIVTKEMALNDEYQLTISYKSEGDIISHVFSIPIR